jgi:putative oxidoreductase
MTSPLESRLDSYAPAVISLFRIVMGFLFTVSGASSLFGWPVDYGDAPPIGSFPMWWAGAIQLIAGLLITFGLFTRIAAFLASGEMAVAYFWRHQPQGLLPIENGGEGAVMFCFAFFLLVFIGGGAFALDALRNRQQSAAVATATRA